MPFPEDGPEPKPESSVYDTKPAFDPYNPPETPEAVQPTPPSPAPSSSAPGFGDTSGADGEPQEAPQGDQEENEKDPLPEFDPKYRDPFTGLLYLGRLQKTFNRWGHTFVVRTLTTEQMAEIGLIVKPYEGTRVSNAVYQAAVVAASVVTVDGKPLPGSIEVDASNELTTVKFPYVMRNWLPPVREGIYNECFDLEVLVRDTLDAMEKASG